ncbi:MAG: hypothetical protein WDW38_010562 [Sanguina aurantia]
MSISLPRAPGIISVTTLPAAPGIARSQTAAVAHSQPAHHASAGGSSSSSSGDEAGDTHSGTESSSDSASDVDSTHAHHTEGTGVRQPAHATFQAQQARLQRLRKDLEACRFMPPMELGCAYNSRASMATLDEAVEGFEVGSSSSSSSAVPGLPSHLQEAEDKMVLTVLPWLLVTHGRLDTRDITHIASRLGLRALLELGLTQSTGDCHLAHDITTGPLIMTPPCVQATWGCVVRLHRLCCCLRRLSSRHTRSDRPPPRNTGVLIDSGISGSVPYYQREEQTASSRSSHTSSSTTHRSTALPGSHASNPLNASSSSSPDPEPSSSVDNSCSSGSSMDDGISGRGPTIPKCEAKSSTEPPESDQQHEHTHFSEDRIKMLINAATALQRLEFRRHGSLHRAAPDSCAVLLHCDELDADVVACVAGWLHWYGKLPLREAIQAAEEKLFWRVEQGLLEAATKYLTDGALDRMNKVVITWTQGGLSAHVAGDIVGSWSTRVSMVRCRRADGCHGFTSPGHFFLVICGLPAGTYYYKYIVDGSWTIDSESDKVPDAGGNWNNQVHIKQRASVLTTPPTAGCSEMASDAPCLGKQNGSASSSYRLTTSSAAPSGGAYQE